MQYIKRDLGSYKLHMIKTDKFKSIMVKVSFRRPIKKQEITMRNILCNMLTQSSNNYKTKRQMAIKAQDLYAASISNNNSRIGNYINTDIVLSTLSDKYTEEGNFKKSLEFLRDIIYNPDVTNNKFNEKSLDIVKTNANIALEGLREDSNLYSIMRLMENMDSDSPISYRITGYLEDLDKVNSSNLYTYYKKMIDKDLMDIFVVGNIDFDEIEELIKENFKIKTFKKCRVKYLLDEKKTRIRKKTVIETDENSQSKLAIGCRVSGLSEYERNYPLTLYSIILGSGTDSKLFKVAREEHSLCYYINAVPNKLDNVILIRAGIDSENIKKTSEVVEQQMKMMQKGKFSEEDINIAKEYFNTALDNIVESESSIISTYYMMELLGLDDIELRRKKMNEVSAEEIVKVAKKIKLDTIYCLEGITK